MEGGGDMKGVSCGRRASVCGAAADRTPRATGGGDGWSLVR
jgi:hypothetical protein